MDAQVADRISDLLDLDELSARAPASADATPRAEGTV
jgi:hypothetical protein